MKKILLFGFCLLPLLLTAQCGVFNFKQLHMDLNLKTTSVAPSIDKVKEYVYHQFPTTWDDIEKHYYPPGKLTYGDYEWTFSDSSLLRIEIYPITFSPGYSVSRIWYFYGAYRRHFTMWSFDNKSIYWTAEAN